jgi:hypothetical protein
LLGLPKWDRGGGGGDERAECASACWVGVPKGCCVEAHIYARAVGRVRDVYTLEIREQLLNKLPGRVQWSQVKSTNSKRHATAVGAFLVRIIAGENIACMTGRLWSCFPCAAFWY